MAKVFLVLFVVTFVLIAHGDCIPIDRFAQSGYASFPLESEETGGHSRQHGRSVITEDEALETNRFPEDDEGGSGESRSSRQERAAIDDGSGHYADRNVNKPFTMSVSSGLRWSGLSLADIRLHDDPTGNVKSEKRNKDEKDVQSARYTTWLVIFVIGGTLIVLLSAAFFVFAWPLRKYYTILCQRMDHKDTAAGWYNDDLSSVKVESSYLAEYDTVPLPPTPPPSPPTKGRKTASGRKMPAAVYKQPKPTRPKMSPNQRTPDEIIAQDRRRDSRNAEMRKIIKRQTSERVSLADNLLIAKANIDGHTKNRQFEKKASERRRVIQRCCSAYDSIPNGRRVTFADELETACSVVTPKWDHKQSLERSKEKCRAVKEQLASTGKRRPSFEEEIGVAKELIVDKERKKPTLPPEAEMIRAQNAPGGPIEYYNEVLNKLLVESEQAAEGEPVDDHSAEIEALASDDDIDELTSCSGPFGLSTIDDEEPEAMIENELLWRDDAGFF